MAATEGRVDQARIYLEQVRRNYLADIPYNASKVGRLLRAGEFLLGQVREAEGRVAALREALAPFAEDDHSIERGPFGEEWDECRYCGTPTYLPTITHESDCPVTLARAALAAAPDGAGMPESGASLQDTGASLQGSDDTPA